MDVVPLVVTGLLLHEISLDLAGCEDHNPCIPCILAILVPSLATKLNQISTSDMILKPMFPAKEPRPHHQCNDVLGRHFGVPTQITATSWHEFRITASEILLVYIITLPHNHLHSTLQSHPSTISPVSKVLNATLFNATSSKKNSILNWSDAYQTDPNTSSIFLHLQSNQNK